MRFVDGTGTIQKAKASPGGSSEPIDAGLDQKVADALKRLTSRITALESQSPPAAIEFDVTCPASGNVTIQHGFTGAIRWYVTSWRRKTNGGTYSLSEVTETPVEGVLTLASKSAGQAVIRVESVQGGQGKRSSATADAAQNLAGTTIGGSQYDIVESDGAGGVSYLTQASGASNKWVKYGATGPTYSYLDNGAQYDVVLSDGSNGFSHLTQASGAANQWVKYGATGPTYSDLHSKAQYDVLISDGSKGFSSVTQASGSAGKILTWGSSGPTWTTNSAALAGWQTAYNLDFTSLGTITISGNGSVTVDGKTWTVSNYAKSSVFGISAANGLDIKCSAAANSMAPTGATAPLIQMASIDQYLSGLVPDDVRFGLRIQFYISAYTRGTAGDSSGVMISTSDANFSDQRIELEHTNSGGTQKDWFRFCLTNTTRGSGDIAAILTSPSTHNCLEMEMPYFGTDVVNFSTGIWNAGWPTKWYRRAALTATAATWLDVRFKQQSDARVAFYTQTSSAAGTCETKFGAVRIQYLLYTL